MDGKEREACYRPLDKLFDQNGKVPRRERLEFELKRN